MQLGVFNGDSFGLRSKASRLRSPSCWRLLPPPGAQNDDKIVPQEPGLVKYSFAPIVKKVKPAVVNVYASRVETMPRNPLFDDPVFKRFFGDQGSNSRTAKSLGSGSGVDAKGLVVTNYHVIDGMTEVVKWRFRIVANSRPTSCCAIHAPISPRC